MDAARSQSRFSSQLAHRLELLRLKAKANGGHEGSMSMETFDCFTLCQSCRRLGEAHEVCSHCGAREPLELKNFTYARSFQELEEAQRRDPPWWGKLIGHSISAASFGLLTWLTLHLCGMMGSMGIPVFFASIGVVLGVAIAIGKGLRGPIVRLLRPRRTETPLRWRNDLVTPSLQLAAEATSPVLYAPLTNRPCRGYHVQIELHDPEAMHRVVWLLDEKVATPSAADQLLQQATSAQSGAPLQQHELIPSLMKREQYLRARGLTQDEGELRFYETIIP